MALLQTVWVHATNGMAGIVNAIRNAMCFITMIV